MSARSDSTTELRPATNSGASPAPRAGDRAARSSPGPAKRGPAPDWPADAARPENAARPEEAARPDEARPDAGRPEAAPDRLTAADERLEAAPGELPWAALRWAGWPGRSSAGGVGPLPSRARLPLPPVPVRGLPFLVRPEPGRAPRPDLGTCEPPTAREPPEAREFFGALIVRSPQGALRRRLPSSLRSSVPTTPRPQARSRRSLLVHRFSSQRGPSAVSSTTTPILSRPSLIASAAA